MIFGVFLLSLLTLYSAQADCENSKPQKICFADEAYANDIRTKMVLNQACDGAEIIKIKTGDAVTQKLEALSQSACSKVSSITFLSHGSEGALFIGKELIWREDDFKRIFKNGKYSKLLTPDAELVFTGCDVGRSCKGRLTMLAATQNLAKDKPLKVYAANSKTVNLFTHLTSRTGSMNGSDLVFEQKLEKQSWTFEGLSDGEAMSLAQSCKADCSEQLKTIQELQKITHHKVCKNKNYSGIMQIFLADVQDLATRCSQAKVDHTWESGRFFNETKLTLEDLEYLNYTVTAFAEKRDLVKQTCEDEKKGSIYPVLYKQIDQKQAIQEFNKKLPYFIEPAN